MTKITRKLALVAQWVCVASLVLAAFGAVPSQANDDDPNTVKSSTMVFEGTLTDEGGGKYSGTLAMVDAAGEDPGNDEGDGDPGFDVYARNDAIAIYDKDGSDSNEDYAHGPVTDHDAWTTAGGWGSTYDPDCADYEHYQLTLDGSTNEWFVEYNSGGTTYAAPMSGPVDWDHGTDGYAVETGIGDYDDYTGGGTAEKEGYIEIQLDVDDSGTDRVILTPACMPVWLEFEDDWVEVAPPSDPDNHPEAHQTTVYVMMSGSGFNGVDLDLNYQDYYLDVVSGSVSEGSMWSGYSSNVMRNETSGGHVYFKDYIDDQGVTLGGTHMQVAQFTVEGEHDKDDASLTFQSLDISDLDGIVLDDCPQDDTLTVHGHGTIEGDVQLQGRFVGGGDTSRHADATVTITGGPEGSSSFEYSGSTNANGHWSIGDVIEGSYDVEVEMDLYLSAERPTPKVSFTSGGGAGDAGFVKLLGGDCTLNDAVGSGDASIVATHFGSTGVNSGDDADPADINDDGNVDILDCSILGGNFGLSGPTTAPW